MAQLEANLQGDFDEILRELDHMIVNGSASAAIEGESDFYLGDCICAVRVYERFSMIGGNRVSLSLTLLQAGGQIKLSAITAGGSQAMFFKVNTFGEEAFLDVIRATVQKYQV